MCGRFALTVDADSLIRYFPWLMNVEKVAPRYNIAPGQPVAVISNQNAEKLDYFLWGLIPSWAKDRSIGNRLINARAETLKEKPSFRNAYRRRRCLIPADGFYEWKASDIKKGKIPYYFRLTSGKPFCFAGLWEIWQGTEGSEILSCTIITTQANETLAPFHERMPVILPREAYTTWLNKDEVNPATLDSYLVPYPAEEMIGTRVSNLVNNPSIDHPDCINP
jgi:putative SOS response-associated peptidase YedK